MSDLKSPGMILLQTDKDYHVLTRSNSFKLDRNLKQGLQLQFQIKKPNLSHHYLFHKRFRDFEIVEISSPLWISCLNGPFINKAIVDFLVDQFDFYKSVYFLLKEQRLLLYKWSLNKPYGVILSEQNLPSKCCQSLE